MNETNVTKTYAVDLERIATTHYRATNAEGVSVDFGLGEGLMSPVELLLAAVAGCASVDVDVVTSRRAEPERFAVHTEGDRVLEAGASRLGEVRVSFDVRFGNDAAGESAAALVDRLMQISHDKECTVSRTVESPTSVRFERRS